MVTLSSRSLYHSEHFWAGEMAQSSARVELRILKTLNLTLELTAQALCHLPTYLEPKVFTKVSLDVFSGINPPVSNMETAPMGLTENG